MNNQRARDIRKFEISTSTLTYGGGYTKDYVRELENEISKLVTENLYLKSNEYQNKILSRKDSSTESDKELESKVNTLTQENDKLHQEKDTLTKENDTLHQEKNKLDQEKKLMTLKINRLSQLVHKLSYDLIDRENILTTLKEILEE
jgi:hypothetical protein